MDILRRTLITSLALASRLALATGDYWEEPVHTLPDFLTLDQLPAKSFEEIFRETKPAAPAPAVVDFQAEILALAVALEKLEPAKLLPTVDGLLAAARARQSALGPGVTNLLQDVRDLCTAGTAKPAEAAEAAEYVRWRVEHAAYFGLTWKAREDGGEGGPIEAAEAETAELAKRLAAASPALRPHWLYLRGAYDFKHGQDTAAQDGFRAVLAEAPRHARAEAALFMVARCQLSRSRTAEYLQAEPQLEAAERPRVKLFFEQYLKQYPQGRFVGDALGWLGAFAHDGGDFAGALGYYLRQLEVPEHPEFIQPAAIMCEKLLSHLASQPNDKALREVAKQPRVAQALVYLIVNASESDNFNGEFDAVAAVQGWRKKLLPRVAAALAGQEKLYAEAPWRPRYLAALALAASGADQQEQALKLLNGAGDAVEKSDDLLFARGVALQRAPRAKDAAIVFQSLLKMFPQSPLVPGTQLRLGLALCDDHQAGEAVLALRPLAQPPVSDRAENEVRPILATLPAAEVRQLVDAQLNFAPPAELAAAAQKPGLDPLARLQLTEALAARHLAKEQFDEAKKYLTPAQWELAGAPLEKLTTAARAATDPAAKATACLKLGDAWAAARGKLLTFPLDTDKLRREVFEGDAARANQRRLASATALGVKGSVALDLENRDELRHAFNWWLEASDAQPGTPASATALWRALQAMPRIADVSPFTYERALAKKWDGVSRKLYDRLRQECPESEEAKRLAVYWNFPPNAADNDNWYRELAGQDLPGREVFFPEAGDQSEDGAALSGLTNKILALEKDASLPDGAALRQQVESLRTEAGRALTSLNASFWINYLDDLGQFLAAPDPGPEVRKTYFDLRGACLRRSAFGFWEGIERAGESADGKPDPDTLLRQKIKDAMVDPQMKPVADFLAFLDAAVVANHLINVPFVGADKDGEPYTYRARDYPLLEKMLASFLVKYPRSRKREAALLLHVRALYYCSQPVVFKKEVTWPQASRWEGGYEASFTAPEPFDAERIFAALDMAEREFPGGRYAADLRGYRAAVELRMRHWKTALALSVAQLDDPKAVHLQGETADRLGEIFAQLADETARADVLAAIKANPRAREFLQKYLAAESALHPLQYLKAYLRDQLASK